MRIKESLQCLPVYLSGCKFMAVLVGHTYSTRLWWYVLYYEYRAQLPALQDNSESLSPRTGKCW